MFVTVLLVFKYFLGVISQQVRVDVLAYSESDGVPDWEELDEVSYAAPNTGRFGWIPRPNYQITDQNAVGIIRVTRRHKR